MEGRTVKRQFIYVPPIFPTAQLHGCNFQFTQNTWRKIQTLGLAPVYPKRDATHKFIRRLKTLAFLPAEHIPVSTSPIRSTLWWQESPNLPLTGDWSLSSEHSNATRCHHCQSSVVFGSACINTAQLVGRDDGTSLVPVGNWQTHLSPCCRTFVGIKKYHHFRYILASSS